MTEPTPPRVYVLIGGSGGIGRALAPKLASRGAKVIVAGRNLETGRTMSEAQGTPFVEVEASDFKAVAEMLKTVQEEFGRLDGVVNLAGSILLKSAHLTKAAEFEDCMRQNLTTAFATVAGAAKLMRKEGGAIVLMSSAAGRFGLPNHEAIAAAKAGVIGLARSAAATYAPNGIRINVVAPGLVDTPMAAKLTQNETTRAHSERMHPLGRIGNPEEIATAIDFLISPTQTWITGQVLGIDGGLATVKSRG